MTAVRFDADVEVDVDLDAPVVCQAVDCDRSASWWMWISHVDGSSCGRLASCTTHRTMYDRWVSWMTSRGYLITCTSHDRQSRIKWTPLH